MRPHPLPSLYLTTFGTADILRQLVEHAFHGGKLAPLTLLGHVLARFRLLSGRYLSGSGTQDDHHPDSMPDAVGN